MSLVVPAGVPIFWVIRVRMLGARGTGIMGERRGKRVGRCVISALDTIHPAAWRRWTRRVCCCILSVSALS